MDDELAKKKKKNKPKPNHYFNNEEVRTLIENYYESKEDTPEQEKYERELCDKLFLLCRNLSTAGNFYRYSWKDEFVADAIERCWKAVQNQKFDLEMTDKKGDLLKPFSYFSRIASREFIKIIKKEKKIQTETERYKEEVFRDIYSGKGFEKAKPIGNHSDEEFFIDGQDDGYTNFFEYED